MESIKSQLLDMGFSESKVKKAISSCPEAQTIEQVMEWLIAHEDELNADTNEKTPNTGGRLVKSNQSKEAETAQDHVTTATTAVDAGIKPGETAAEAAARKKITAEEAQKLIVERQKIRAEEERKKAIEDEKKRRETGQKMLMTRQELQDQERIHLAQQIRREKMEKEAHRKRVLEQIARDREAMKNKNKPLAPKNESNNKTSSGGGGGSKSATECKLALRFADGSSKVQNFSPQEQLSAVRLFVQMEKSYAQTANIEFVAPPNKKLSDEQMDKTLDSLGLCPASRLEVKYNQSALANID